ncbi:MAG: GMC family oxidoreductase N-terminal domain-containing protein [Beijerinckiaceae bacterium]|nr:GMC family oxidoreductase N-terminal domain-containing protein [Beijerinckiaceae bacterium]MCZ8299440.1 GMC family oxidoreductase N-terminal domain-containing protein [Beijerinckiaceae bacterium]
MGTIPADPAGEFDDIIVGAGTAGCLLANRLSADPARRVLLLEAGGNDRYIWFHIPVGYLFLIGNPRADWLFKTAPVAGLNGRSLLYPRGKVLGGCSAINGMIYMRGQSTDYDGWAQLGLSGWSWEDVLPYFRQHEDFFAGADALHGAGGEWRVEPPRVRWDILDRFRDAAEQCGIPKVEDFNRGSNEGSAYFQVNQKKGLRWSAARGFLDPVRNRPNLTILTGAEAERILFEGNRASGLAFRQDGQSRVVRARRSVVLAAGAVASPKLLMLSGIGRGEALRSFGLEVVADRPGVGQNLQDHLQIRPIYKVRNVRTLNADYANLLKRAWMGVEFALFRSGPMTMAPSQLGVFTRSDARYAMPNLQFHVQPLSLDKFGEGLHPFPAFTASVCNLRPTSRGEIRLASADPFEAPVIDPNYLATEEDRQVAADSLRLVRRIVASEAMRPFEPEEYRPGPDIRSEADLIRAAGDLGTTIFHPVGTARMGRRDDPQAVVDERLSVIGVEGLRVIDASVMPTITSGNTNSPTLMIAEKGAAMLMADTR